MTRLLPPDEIRTMFSMAMSEMYRHEVPQYGTLIDLVQEINKQVLDQQPQLQKELGINGELDRLNLERHGAIRLGTAEELSGIRRMFAVMGMFPVGYYDLSVAGLPVHSTAFRPTNAGSLQKNPFRVFTSLLRLELLEDRSLAREAAEILSQRKIFTEHAVHLIAKAQTQQGLNQTEAEEFVSEALKTFRWHSQALVDLDTYKRLHTAHPLIADIVSFRGPHINHLTPRTLDIDAVQRAMPERGINPKAVIEGPPRRKAPILLRQTSFKALEEAICFDKGQEGTHTARFGEIEQRGVALTPKGRALYDTALLKTRTLAPIGADAAETEHYNEELNVQFSDIPDHFESLRENRLAYFSYSASAPDQPLAPADSVKALIDSGYLVAFPQTYEDFLPVSAAGIFQSNLGGDEQSNYRQSANQAAFETALGAKVVDEMELYSTAQQDSLDQALKELGQSHLRVAPSS